MSTNQSTLDTWAEPTGRNIPTANTRQQDPFYINNNSNNNATTNQVQPENINGNETNNDNRNISQNVYRFQTSMDIHKIELLLQITNIGETCS